MSTAFEQESKTYFGDSLEEVLPRIREELGPDALIVRQREGIVGGIGGFFGRKCVEVEAQPASPPLPSLPPRSIIDAYDSAPPFEPFLEAEDGRSSDEQMLAKEPAGDDLLEAMLAQSSPFAATLSSALQEAPPRTSVFEPGWERLAGEAQPSAAPSAGPPVADDEPWAPVPDDRAAAAVLERIPTQVARSRQAVRSTVLEVVDELAGLRAELVSASVPLDLAGEIIAEARDGLRSFDPDTPMRELVRRSLTSRIPLAQVRVTGQRRIAVVGTAGSGRTLAAASLMCAYAQAGHSVGALSLEPGRKAVRLADLLGGLDAPFEVAQTPAAVTRATAALGATDVVIADVPALRDGVDPRCLSKALALLKAFRPDETHVVMPAGTGAEEGRALVDALTATELPLRLIVSHTDDQAPSGVAVGVALTHRIPVSFVGCGPSIGRLRPPEPHVLASMVIA